MFGMGCPLPESTNPTNERSISSLRIRVILLAKNQYSATKFWRLIQSHSNFVEGFLLSLGINEMEAGQIPKISNRLNTSA